MTFIQMTQIFLLDTALSTTASTSKLGTQVLESWSSDIYLLKTGNMKKMTPKHASVYGPMMYEQYENSVIYNYANTLK
jgi:hypothetical protein